MLATTRSGGGFPVQSGTVTRRGLRGLLTSALSWAGHGSPQKGRRCDRLVRQIRVDPELRLIAGEHNRDRHDEDDRDTPPNEEQNLPPTAHAIPCIEVADRRIGSDGCVRSNRRSGSRLSLASFGIRGQLSVVPLPCYRVLKDIVGCVDSRRVRRVALRIAYGSIRMKDTNEGW